MQQELLQQCENCTEEKSNEMGMKSFAVQEVIKWLFSSAVLQAIQERENVYELNSHDVICIINRIREKY